MSKVYLAPCGNEASDSDLQASVKALWSASGLADIHKPNDLAALKIHVGEPGTRTFVQPAIAAALVSCIQETGASPFTTDTAVLYNSPRDNGAGHAAVAVEHGFGMERIGAPFIPADGLKGDEEVEVEVDGRHYRSVRIASAVVRANSMLVLTHATGHLGTGFGGVLKNLGMGCCSRKGKLSQHHGQQPRIDPESCTACGDCVLWCPSGAINVTTAATIDDDKCIGCGECIAVCRDEAVLFDWTIKGGELSERIVEHAAAVIGQKPGRIGYVTSVLNVTKNCDCLGVDEKPLLPGIGLMASSDPVALDQAVHDLITKEAGRRLEAISYPSTNGLVQIAYAESLGLGSREYELVIVSV